MDAIKSLVQPLVGGAGGSGVIDGMKLVVLGGTVETARRVSSSAWSQFVNSFFLTAHFSEEDYPYDWLMLWLSRRPEWTRSREFETTTRSTTPGFSSKIADNSFGDEDFLDDVEAELNGDGSEEAPGRVKTRVVFQPTFDMTHTIYYRGHWLRIKRSRKNDGVEVLSISVVARSNTILKQLVLQAKREYEAEAIHRIQIYFADSHGCWRWTDSRHKRPMGSIVLNPGVKEMLLADTKDFLASEKWYADRGIPFRRGYLLHGVPGSGKSSLIHAIAGELMLDIYVVSLSSSWISDSTLTTLMGRVPARCIVLLEDLDAAFTRSVSRDDSDKDKDKDNKDKGKDGNNDSNTNSTSSSSSSSRRRRRDDQMSDINTLSLSGLLNALDGVAAAEGRILFATTNHLERLDPALSRPGRMDVWVEFKNASKWQAEALFRNFFPSVDEDDTLSRSGSSSRGTSHSRSTTSSSSSSGARSRAESNVSSTSMSTLPSEPVALTKEEEDELAGLGIQLPSPPSEVTASPVGSEASLVNHSPPPTTRTSSSWSTPVSPSLSSISSAIWSLPSFASSTASLLGGGSAPAPAAAPTPALAVSKGRSKTPKPLPQFGENNQAYMPPPVEDAIAKASHSAKPLDKETLNRLAKHFAESIPEEEFSVAALQGYLLKNKSRPEAAADEAAGWVQSEREIKEKLKREKAKREEERERRRKEKAEKEREEKRKKEEQEKEEKRKKEREEEERVKKEKEEEEKAKQTAAAAAVVVEAKPAEPQVEAPSEPAQEAPMTTSSETVMALEPLASSTSEPVPPPPPPSEPQPEPAVVSMPGSDSDSESDDSDEENLPPKGSSLSRGAQASSSWTSASWGTIIRGGDYDD